MICLSPLSACLPCLTHLLTRVWHTKHHQHILKMLGPRVKQNSGWKQGQGKKIPLPQVQQNNLLRTTSVIKGIILLSAQGPRGLFLLCSLVQVQSFCWDVPHGVTPAACQKGNFVFLLLRIGVIYI